MAQIPASRVSIQELYGQCLTRGKVAILSIYAAINLACAAFIIKVKRLSFMFLYRLLQSKYDDFRQISEKRGRNQGNLSAPELNV